MQYRLVAAALRIIRVPTYLITGDHNMEPRSLANFYTLAQANSLPLAAQVRSVRCLFLDMCGPGQGGPDFRLGATQLA